MLGNEKRKQESFAYSFLYCVVVVDVVIFYSMVVFANILLL